MQTNSKGFTLIELLVVVLIIGILAAIAMPEYIKSVERSRMAEMVTLLGNIAHAQQRKYMHVGRYIDNFTALDVAPEGASGSTFYTKGNPSSGEGGNGYELVLHSGNYNEGYVDAIRYRDGGQLQYNYTVRRMYNSPHTTCLSEETKGQSLCADFCGIDTAVAACCSNGTSSACTAD